MINFLENGGTPNWIQGDINQDLSIDILDIIYIIDIIIEFIIPTPTEIWISDINLIIEIILD